MVGSGSGDGETKWETKRKRRKMASSLTPNNHAARELPAPSSTTSIIPSSLHSARLFFRTIHAPEAEYEQHSDCHPIVGPGAPPSPRWRSLCRREGRRLTSYPTPTDVLQLPTPPASQSKVLLLTTIISKDHHPSDPVEWILVSRTPHVSFYKSPQSVGRLSHPHLFPTQSTQPPRYVVHPSNPYSMPHPPTPFHIHTITRTRVITSFTPMYPDSQHLRIPLPSNVPSTSPLRKNLGNASISRP